MVVLQLVSNGEYFPVVINGKLIGIENCHLYLVFVKQNAEQRNFVLNNRACLGQVGGSDTTSGHFGSRPSGVTCLRQI